MIARRRVWALVFATVIASIAWALTLWVGAAFGRTAQYLFAIGELVGLLVAWAWWHHRVTAHG